MNMVVVFDLDDTLYDELTYAKSGLLQVAYFLEQEKQLNAKMLFQQFCFELQKSRNHIFDKVLQQHQIYTKALLKKCISVYHLHIPDITLWKQAKYCLERLSSLPLYLVTDGNKVVQNNKIKKLNIEPYFKQVFITHRFGIKNAKPSPYCFQLIAKKEKTSPKNIVYVADNINKDFVGIKPLGFRTIRVETGQYTTLQKTKAFHAELTIKSLDELSLDFFNQFFLS